MRCNNLKLSAKRETMQEQTLFLALSTMLLTAGICVLGLALFCYVHARRMDNLPAAVSGEVIGLVKMRFFGRKTLGKVPYHTYASYHGGFAAALFPWVPCVRYTVGGSTSVCGARAYGRICGTLASA